MLLSQSQHSVGEVLIPLRHCWRDVFSVFALAVDRFVGRLVVLVVQLVSRHSCVADRVPVVVGFPAGPQVRLKTVDPPKGNGLGQKDRFVGRVSIS